MYEKTKKKKKLLCDATWGNGRHGIFVVRAKLGKGQLFQEHLKAPWNQLERMHSEDKAPPHGSFINNYIIQYTNYRQHVHKDNYCY